jgi:hypothetical protein
MQKKSAVDAHAAGEAGADRSQAQPLGAGM